jgi:hypothetical protein
MKKLFAIATMLVFVFAASSVYACGEKSSTAKASKASYGSECGSKATKASTADSGSEKAEVTRVDYKAKAAGTKNYCNKKGENAKASTMKADAGSGCHGKVEASEASVMKADAGNVNCPATKDCPVPCNKDTESIKANDKEVKFNKMKAEKSMDEDQPTQASSEVISEASVD